MNVTDNRPHYAEMHIRWNRFH